MNKSIQKIVEGGFSSVAEVRAASKTMLSDLFSTLHDYIRATTPETDQPVVEARMEKWVEALVENFMVYVASECFKEVSKSTSGIGGVENEAKA